MGNQVVFRRDHFIVVRSYSTKGSRKSIYYTIVNTKTSKHSHVYQEELSAAIMICKYAYKNEIPNKYPKWMKESIRRILDNE